MIYRWQNKHAKRCPLSLIIVGVCSDMCDSLQPQGLQPTRFFCVWDFPGKNTGVGCHFLLQEIFPNQGSNPQFSSLIHWQVGSLLLVPPGKPEKCKLKQQWCTITNWSKWPVKNSKKVNAGEVVEKKETLLHCWKMLCLWRMVQFSSVKLLSRVQLFATPWNTACQASLSVTNSQNSPKLMSIESDMPSSHLILCRPLLLLPSIFPSIRVFSSEPALHIRWPKYWRFSFNISPSNEHPGLISFRMEWLDLLADQGTRVFSNTTVQKQQFFSAQLSL